MHVVGRLQVDAAVIDAVYAVMAEEQGFIMLGRNAVAADKAVTTDRVLGDCTIVGMIDLDAVVIGVIDGVVVNDVAIAAAFHDERGLEGWQSAFTAIAAVTTIAITFVQGTMGIDTVIAGVLDRVAFGRIVIAAGKFDAILADIRETFAFVKVGKAVGELEEVFADIIVRYQDVIGILDQNAVIARIVDRVAADRDVIAVVHGLDVAAEAFTYLLADITNQNAVVAGIEDRVVLNRDVVPAIDFDTVIADVALYVFADADIQKLHGRRKELLADEVVIDQHVIRILDENTVIARVVNRVVADDDAGVLTFFAIAFEKRIGIEKIRRC